MAFGFAHQSGYVYIYLHVFDIFLSTVCISISLYIYSLYLFMYYYVYICNIFGFCSTPNHCGMPAYQRSELTATFADFSGMHGKDPKSLGRVRRTIHPGRFTWNLQITHLERKMIFQTSMIMFHVNLQGCIFSRCKKSDLPTSIGKKMCYSH